MPESAQTPPAKPDSSPKLASQLIAWAQTAFPAVLSTIGLSGLVSILGAAVLWARFNAAGLPANEAVADQPTGSLITTGAASLALYLTLGLLAVLVVYLLQGVVLSQVLSKPSSADPVGRLKREAKLAASRVVELEHDLTEAKKATTSQQQDLKRLQKEAHDAKSAVEQAEKVHDDKPQLLPDLQTRAEDATQAAGEAQRLLKEQSARVRRLQQEAQDETLRADEVTRALFAARSQTLTTDHLGNAAALLVLVSLELALVFARTTASWSEKGLLWLSLLVVAVAAITSAYKAESVTGWFSRGPRLSVLPAAFLAFVAIGALVDPWTLAPVIASLVLALGCFAIGRLHPRRFFWLGISIFTSVALFGAVLTYSRDVNAPSAQAAAVLMNNGCAMGGLWIGESSERVFLARVGPDGSSTSGSAHVPSDGRIFSLKRSQVISESIGKLRRVPYANQQAAKLRLELLANQSESMLTTSTCTATGQTSDYFAGSLSSFKGPAALHAEALSKPLCLVRYFDRRRAKTSGGDPGASWWTTCEYDKGALGSVARVRQKLALPKAWGARDARVTATIPTGTAITYLSGTAARQCEDGGKHCYEGGGTQLLFHDRDVNRRWLGRIECDETPESAPISRFAACQI